MKIELNKLTREEKLQYLAEQTYLDGGNWCIAPIELGKIQILSNLTLAHIESYFIITDTKRASIAKTLERITKNHFGSQEFKNELKVVLEELIEIKLMNMGEAHVPY